MAELVIFGAGDIARIAAHYFETDSPHKVVAFAVDEDFREADEFEGIPLIDFSRVEQEYPPSNFKMFIAVSYARMNSIRQQKYEEAKNKGYELVSYVSSRCNFLSQYPVGENTFVFEDNTIQPFVKIGNNVIIWSGNHIGHDSVIEDHNFISSHVVISGHVKVGPGCFLGVNATLHNSISIGAHTLIAAGAIISTDTAEASVWVPERSKAINKRSYEIEL